MLAAIEEDIKTRFGGLDNMEKTFIWKLHILSMKKPLWN